MRRQTASAEPQAGEREPSRGRTRAERTEATRRALFQATAQVVGQHGYAEASIARITERVGVAQGTFYNYFASRQELLDELLPELGEELLRRIRTSRGGVTDPADREEAGFLTFFDYLLEVPEFYRILNEAETFAPRAHRRHVENMTAGYVRALARARAAGRLQPLEDRELEAVAYMLLAARHYLAMRYTYRDGGVTRPPRWVADTYMRVLKQGLFAPADGPATPAPPQLARPRAEPQPLVDELSPGRARLVLATDPQQLDAEGRVRRGVLAELVEAAAAQAAAPHGEGLTLLSLSLNLLRPALDGRLVCEAVCQERGAGLAFATAELRQGAPDGPLVAGAQLTFRRN